MKLLFDQNLSPKLPRRLADLFPESIHVRGVGKATGEDIDVWQLARDRGFAVVTKDEDFRQRALVVGAPPLVVWLKFGNCTTTLVEQVLRTHAAQVLRCGSDPSVAMIVLTPDAAYAVVHGGSSGHDQT